jgi:hypothetical protein
MAAARRLAREAQAVTHARRALVRASVPARASVQTWAPRQAPNGRFDVQRRVPALPLAREWRGKALR